MSENADAVRAMIEARNARVAAWRDRGVPVHGGWTLHDAERGFATVGLHCERCGTQVGGAVDRELGLEDDEIALARLLAERGCRDVGPLFER